VTKVLSSKNGKINVWGTGEEERDLLYVDDLSKFVEKTIDRQRSPYALYNCGYGSAITIKDLVSKIILTSKKSIVIEHDLSQPTIKTSLCLDCSKARNEIGWEPETTLDQGIEKTINWWNDNVGAK
jgi:nucleoside-diphosphate-sugar epimerase